MKTDVSGDESVLCRLAENNDESAMLAMLIQFCRESPELRHWLWEDFGKDAKVRAKFAQVVDDAASSPVRRFTDLAYDNANWQEECRRLREQMPPGLYGGLTWNQLMQLIRRFQAGTIDLGAFLLAHDWRKAGKSTPVTKWAAIELLERVIPSGRRRLLRHLDSSLAFLKGYENKAQRRSMLGYNDRWKMHVLFYMLRHPAKSYRTRELCAQVASLGFKVSAKDMRRFCARHGIQRDMRAGRPSKAESTKPTETSIRPTSKHRGHKAGSL